MHTTYQLCRAVQRRHNIPSVYALAKKFSVRPQSAHKWVKKKAVFATENAIQCAILLDLNPYYVMACAEYERAKNQESKMYWKAMAENPPEYENFDQLKEAY